MKLLSIIALLAFGLNCSAQTSSKPAIFFTDSATYTGIIKGYVPKPGNTTGMVYINSLLKGIQESSLIRIAKDGSFSAKFLMHYPQDVFISFPGAGFKGCSFSVYLEPGKEVFQSFDPITLSTNSTYPASIFKGDLATINTELVSSRALYHQISYSHKDAESNPLFFEELLAIRLKSLAKYKDSVGLSEKTFKLLGLNIKMAILNDYATYILDSEQNLPAVKFNAFINCLASQTLNEEINVSSASYKYLINRLQYSRRLVPERDDQWLEIARRMSSEIAFTAQEKVELSGLNEKNGFINFINSHPQYSGQLSSYFFEKRSLLHINALKAVLGISDGLMFDLMRSQIYSQMLEDFFTPFSEKKLAETKKNITTTFLASSLSLHNQEIKARISANKKMTTSPKIEEQEQWDEILKKFKGKVIYVDFWATWCGPCREGIVKVETLKEELKNQDIAFVYITNQSSPLETYQNMVPAIKGNHFRLSNDEWNTISAKFKIGSIPHYMLVGKEGQIINDNLPPLENEELKEKLLIATKF